MSSDLRVVNASVFFRIGAILYFFFFLSSPHPLLVGRQSLGQQTPSVLRLEEEDCELFKSVFQSLYQNMLYRYATLFLLQCWDWYAMFMTDSQHLLGREAYVNFVLLLSNVTPLNSVSTFRKYQN